MPPLPTATPLPAAPLPSATPASASPLAHPRLPRSTPGWSELRRLIFLDVLKRGGAIAAAARAAGMSRAGAYALRDRDPDFDQSWVAVMNQREQLLFRAHVARVDAAIARSRNVGRAASPQMSQTGSASRPVSTGQTASTVQPASTAQTVAGA